MSASVKRALAMLTIVAGFAMSNSAIAETVNILAVGASNTNGKGVSRASAWPALLRRELKELGIDAKVTVNAVNGSTTTQMLARLKRAITAKPDVVVLSIPLTNDRRRKVNTAANVDAMKALLEKNSIKLVLIDRPHVWGEHQMQKDRIHFNVAGHKTYASKTAEMVYLKLSQD